MHPSCTAKKKKKKPIKIKDLLILMKDSQISQLLTKRRLFSSVLLMNEHLFGPAILFGTLKSGF